MIPEQECTSLNIHSMEASLNNKKTVVTDNLTIIRTLLNYYREHGVNICDDQKIIKYLLHYPEQLYPLKIVMDKTLNYTKHAERIMMEFFSDHEEDWGYLMINIYFYDYKDDSFDDIINNIELCSSILPSVIYILSNPLSAY